MDAKPEKEDLDYRGRPHWRMPEAYRGDAGQFRYVQEAIEQEPISVAMQVLLNAQDRGAVALCAAFRAHPARSRDPRDYPRHVDTMASYIERKMAADILERRGREPLDHGNLRSLALLLARCWAIGVLREARL